jgi:hypothetical protein
VVGAAFSTAASVLDAAWLVVAMVEDNAELKVGGQDGCLFPRDAGFSMTRWFKAHANRKINSVKVAV